MRGSVSRKTRIYDHPVYYDIAFSFYDVRQQLNLIERFISKFSLIPVKRILDLGCGPSPQLLEAAKRGYSCTGLDENPGMLRYLQMKAAAEGLRIKTVQADMCDFRLPGKVDCALIMSGTIGLIESRERLLSHLDSVAGCLRKGGLYIVENAETDWARSDFFRSQSWVVKEEETRVKATCENRLLDALKQMQRVTLRLEVTRLGETFVLEESRDVRIVFPQEFLALLRLDGKFEFIGWFEPDRMKRLREAKEDNFLVLRRK